MLLNHVADGAELTVREDEPDVAHHLGQELERGARGRSLLDIMHHRFWGGVFKITATRKTKSNRMQENRMKETERGNKTRTARGEVVVDSLPGK